MLRLLSQWAGATAIVALLGCLIAGALEIQFSLELLAPAEDAFDLARAMAVLGGGAVVIAAVTPTRYWWAVGVASGMAAVAGIAASAICGAGFAAASRRPLTRPGRAPS